MPLALPNLDDRRWADLVDEARARIPFHAPEWTDHNVHDPGITLLELYAWLTERDIYRLNRISEAQRLKFLALVGVRPEPPRPSQTIVSFALTANGPHPPLPLPAGLVVEADDPFGVPTPFRLLDDLTVVDSFLQAVQRSDGRRFEDLTARRQTGEPIAIFGDDPHPDRSSNREPRAGLYLGFTRDLQSDADEPVSLYFVLGDLATCARDGAAIEIDLTAGIDERGAIEDEISAGRASCRPSDGLTTCEASDEDCGEPGTGSCGDPVDRALAHHSARTVWEYRDAQGTWRTLDPRKGEIEDLTRAFTLNGRVSITPPKTMGRTAVGAVGEELYYLRCRFVSGTFDTAPRAVALAVNAVRVEQSAPPPSGAGPAPSDPDQQAVDAVGTGTGLPEQCLTLPGAPVLEACVEIYTRGPDEPHEGACSIPWERRDDFDASSRRSAHYLLNATTGEITFGDGEHGRAVPEGASVLASYLTTRGEAGNLAALLPMRVQRSKRNAGLLGAGGLTVDAVDERLRAIQNIVPATGGTAAETVTHAEGRALERVERVERAVTLEDHEILACRTPGVRLARAHAMANVHTVLPCVRANGVVTVVVMPFLPAGRPTPSSGLRRAVAAYLRRRRVIGSRVEVVGPVYREIVVRAKVQACAGADGTKVRDGVRDVLERLLHPLEGGPPRPDRSEEGRRDERPGGWPLGRDVYRNEVLQVIDRVTGVDYVVDLELIADGGEPTCGNVCLGPIDLTTSGTHRIEIVRGGR